MYDMLMRLPLVLWVLLASSVQIVEFIERAPTASPLQISMRASGIAFLLLVAMMVILRTRPSHRASGLEPRISALAGTFLMYSVAFFPRHEMTPAMEVVATLLTMVGSIGSIIALAQLGRSFSLMAESRRLVTTGPYRFVRHPLYITEEIAVIGLFMQFASWWTALLFVLHFAFQLRRIQNEEAVLTTTFPEYNTYRQNTARLIPGVY